MRNSFWNKRIPTLLGLFIITLGIVATTFLTNSTQLIQTNASNSSLPKDVRITNVTDSSFTVSYSTDYPVSGSLNYGKDKNLGQSSLDDRDQKSGRLENYSVHFITVKNLIPLTKYYFTIISGQQTYTTNDLPFEITTAPSLTGNLTQNSVLKGQAGLLDNSALKDTLVYITSDSSQVLSSLVGENGKYSISLDQIRSLDLSRFYAFNNNSVIKILITNGLLSSNAVLYFSQINNIPQIILSQNYDFRSSDMQSASPSANLESFPSFISTSSAQKAPKIITPQKEQGFSDQQPLFKGTGSPGQNVQIIIHSAEQIQTNVSTDNFGNWSFRPSTLLSPGSHTITIITRDASGILRTITQSFVVYASGTQIAQAIGSPTPTPTPTPTMMPTQTPTPTLIQNISPSIFLTQTPTPTIFIDQSATPSGAILPPTGNPSIITIGIVGIFISLMGGLLFFLSRGGI